MAIPFYEPRQQHTTECDQVDGHFPPAPPSSQPMSLPTANPAMSAALIQPPVSASTLAPSALTMPMANSSASTISAAFAASTTTPILVTTSTGISEHVPSFSNPATFSSTASSSQLHSASAAATATFSITSTSPVNCTSLPTNASFSSTESNQTTGPASVPLPTEPLPWKLLAVAMCKALKQYYQQAGTSDVFTTAIIEVMPSGVSGAQGPSSAAGH